MEVKQYTTTILKASEGHYLTEVNDIPNEGRIVADTIYLANPEDASNWKEITIEEGNSIRELQEQLANKTLENE